jgi:hypothetical protein
VLINKLQQSIKTQLFSRHTLLAMLSCMLLMLCGFLSSPTFAQQQRGPAHQYNKMPSVPNKTASLMHLKRDPTRPPSVIVAQLAQALAVKPKYELTAIFTRNKQQYAVVNGAIVKAGDPIANMMVTDISSSNLTMQNNASPQKPMVLELNGAVTIKTQVSK